MWARTSKLGLDNAILITINLARTSLRERCQSRIPYRTDSLAVRYTLPFVFQWIESLNKVPFCSGSLNRMKNSFSWSFWSKFWLRFSGAENCSNNSKVIVADSVNSRWLGLNLWEEKDVRIRFNQPNKRTGQTKCWCAHTHTQACTKNVLSIFRFPCCSCLVGGSKHLHFNCQIIIPTQQQIQDQIWF